MVKLKWWNLKVLALILLVSVLMPLSSVGAASAYDNIVQLGEFVATTGSGGYATNVANVYQLAFENTPAGNCASTKTAWATAKTNPNLKSAVYQSESNDPGSGAFDVNWSWSTNTSFVPAFYSGTPFEDVSFGSSSGTYRVYFSIIYTTASNSYYKLGHNLYLSANCSPSPGALASRGTSGSVTGWHKNRPLFYTGAITYPLGYSGILIPSQYQPSPAKYVAMGDSFSSGEGNPSFENGTATDSVNQCHRSTQSYPRLLQYDQTLGVSPAVFVACSGATTKDVLGVVESDDPVGKWGEVPQVDALTGDTDIVTITIGGNDVGFKEYATACGFSICNFSTSSYSDIVYKINNELPGQLQDVFDEIADRASSTAKIYVTGYPHLAPVQMPTGQGSACFPLNGQQDDPDPELNDGATVRDVVTRINGALSSATDSMQDMRFIYVDPNSTGSPFIGHDWCQFTTSNSYFNIIQIPNIEYSFHPNAAGQNAYYQILKDAIQ